MLKTAFASALACGVLFAAAPAFAQFGGRCERAALQTAADDFLQAQTTGNPFKMHMGLWVQYNEQLQDATMSTGLLSKPSKIAFHHTLIDPQSCTSFTEFVIDDPAHPYVVGSFVRTQGTDVGGIDMVITEPGDWRFNAADTLKHLGEENWSEIPPAERDSRDTLTAVADAYLDHLANPSVAVALGSPCATMEGGTYAASCDAGEPRGQKLGDRRYVVDDTVGGVAVLSSYGSEPTPVLHVFRIEKGKIVHVDTLIACKAAACGLRA